MNDQDNKERRKYERFSFREDILVDGTKLCTITDISEGGIFISAIQAFEQNSIIDITIPFKGHKLTLKAQVQYSQQGIGIGVKFVDINDEQRAIIKKLIESIIKDSTKSKA
jgi:succinyl-CoA synthetase beta subunit